MDQFYNPDHSKPPTQGTVQIKHITQVQALNRISPYCEGCGQNHAYHIHKKKVSTRNNTFLSVLLSRQTLYYISCPNCTFVMELDFAEYKALKTIAH